ncbi:hypothetical protein HYH02_002871 [Chlamydomonas schloesseri]|uniref:Uncharacterized protein n=1 Tax=Chlamydomonas schloesseri TaxID=2026947 RepID=A0A835WRN0_9CHLO|nr:hypothetical protein HYH02_002871 [Chlamydomonas schloesseri]|eukprot:KAG2452637.1 hypothetical protein HYH02_002871 [Chlamydomonas schloesseri]
MSFSGAEDPFLLLLLERRPELEALVKGEIAEASPVTAQQGRAAPQKKAFAFGDVTALPRLTGGSKLSVKARIAGGEPWTRPEPWPILPIACSTASAADGQHPDDDSEGEGQADAHEDAEGDDLRPSAPAPPAPAAPPHPTGTAVPRASGDASSCGSSDSHPPHSLSTIATSCLDAINSPDAAATNSPKALLMAATSSPQCHRGPAAASGGGGGAGAAGQCGSALRRVVMQFDSSSVTGRGLAATALAAGHGAAAVGGGDAGSGSSYLVAVPGGTPVYYDSPTCLPGAGPSSQAEPGQPGPVAAAAGEAVESGAGVDRASRTSQLASSWPVDSSGGGRLAPLKAPADGPANARPMPPTGPDRAAQLSLRILRLQQQQQQQHMLDIPLAGPGAGSELLPPPPVLCFDPLVAVQMPASYDALLDPARMAAGFPTLALQEALGPGTGAAKALVGGSRSVSPVPWDGGPGIAELEAHVAQADAPPLQQQLQHQAPVPHVSHQLLEMPLRRSSLQQQQQQQLLQQQQQNQAMPPAALPSMLPRRGLRHGDASHVINALHQRLQQQQLVMGTAGSGPYVGIVGHKARSQPHQHVADVAGSPTVVTAAAARSPGRVAGFPAKMRPGAGTSSGGGGVGSSLTAGITELGISSCYGAVGSGAGSAGAGGLPSVQQGAAPGRRRASDYGGGEGGLLAGEEAAGGASGAGPLQRQSRASSDGSYAATSPGPSAAGTRQSILGNVADGCGGAGAGAAAAAGAGSVQRVGVAAFGRTTAAATQRDGGGCGGGRAASGEFTPGLHIGGSIRPAAAAVPMAVLPSLRSVQALRSSASSLPAAGAAAGVIGSGGSGSGPSGLKSPHHGLLRAVRSEKQLGAFGADGGAVPTASVVTVVPGAGADCASGMGSPKLLPGGFSGGHDMMVAVLGDFAAVPDLARRPKSYSESTVAQLPLVTVSPVAVSPALAATRHYGYVPTLSLAAAASASAAAAAAGAGVGGSGAVGVRPASGSCSKVADAGAGSSFLPSIGGSSHGAEL